jgi:hypothetical protein
MSYRGYNKRPERPERPAFRVPAPVMNAATNRRFKIPEIQSNPETQEFRPPQYRSPNEQSEIKKLLSQYPDANLVGQIWTMRVHITLCRECTYALRNNTPTGETVNLYELLPSSVHSSLRECEKSPETCENEDMKLLFKWTKAGLPAQVRTTYDVVLKCPGYDPPKIPEYVRRQQNKQLYPPKYPPKFSPKPREERTERKERTPREERADRTERKERTERKPAKKTLHTLPENIIGPKDSKYFLDRPDYKSRNVPDVHDTQKEPPEHSPQPQPTEKMDDSAYGNPVSVPVITKKVHPQPQPTEKMEYPDWDDSAYGNPVPVSVPVTAKKVPVVTHQSSWF